MRRGTEAAERWPYVRVRWLLVRLVRFVIVRLGLIADLCLTNRERHGCNFKYVIQSEPHRCRGHHAKGSVVTELTRALTEANLAELFGLPEEQSWQERALCAQTDPEAFFPEKGGSTREAKRICTGCEVRAECLEYALEHDERFGIWGGLSERERRRLKRRAG
jgi:WhiB family transcriptional regulator, redox-sensing transcriptional regulator